MYQKQWGMFNAGEKNGSSPHISSYPPAFSECLLTRSVVTEGEPVSLSVRVSGTPAPTVKWFHRDQQIKSSPDFELLEQDEMHTLNIPEVFKDDAGPIVVMAENYLGRVQSATELVVRSPADNAKFIENTSSVTSGSRDLFSPNKTLSSLSSPITVLSNQKTQAIQFIKPLVDQIADEGQKLILECLIPSFPPPDSVRWFRNGLEIKPSPDYMISFRQGQCSLTVAEVFAEDSGQYVCTATVQGVPISTTMTLQVQGPPETRYSNATPNNFRAPVFDQPMRDLYQQPGSTAHFQCHVTATPPPEIIWSRRGRPMLDKERYHQAMITALASRTLQSLASALRTRESTRVRL